MINTCRIGEPRLLARREWTDREWSRTPRRCTAFLRSLTKAISHVSPRRNVSALVCGVPCVYPCVHADGRWMARLPRCRSSSWPPRVMPYPLALHNNLPRRVCSGISARTLLARPPFPLPRPPTLLSLDRCCGCVFRPSFIHLPRPSWTRRRRSSLLVGSLSVDDLFAYIRHTVRASLRPIGSFIKIIF